MTLFFAVVSFVTGTLAGFFAAALFRNRDQELRDAYEVWEECRNAYQEQIRKKENRN